MPTRTEQRLATRAALADAAIALFADQGYEAVTMDDIAARAGVSRPTAFRHFRAKAEVITAVQDEWLRIFTEGTQQRLPGESEWHALRRVSHAIASHIEADRRRVIGAAALSWSHPALQAEAYAQFARWQSMIAVAIRPAVDGDLAAAMVGGAMMGMIQSILLAWAVSDGTVDMHALFDDGFARLATGFGHPAAPGAGA